MKRRVVVTGMGAITPIGNNVQTFWSSVKKGCIGFDKITKFDTTGYTVELAAEVKNFSTNDILDFTTARRMELFSQYAVVAAKEALDDANLDMENEDPFRVGTAIGSSVGSLQAVETASETIREQGPRKINPLVIPRMLTNMAAGNVAIRFGLRGKCINVATACATGTNSIGEAFRNIQYGDADIMVTGGTESCITPTCVGGFSILKALSTTTDPLRASIPFDKERNGFVAGEGAGIVILEELEHAQKRNAKIYAEVAGYGSTDDAYHITAPSQDGSGAAKAMELAIEEAGLMPCDIPYINAHGTSTYQNDLFETMAIKRVFKEATKTVKISSTKSMIGHLFGAAGAVEFIVCVKTLTDGFIHQTVGTTITSPECDLDYMIGYSSEQDVPAALSNSFGFGGHNATLVIKKYR